jgi:molybdopterin-guanine dinucleotide biosynthesis protein A
VFDAIVLAGGRGRRLGGVDKPGLLVGRLSLLDHVLDAVGQAQRVVVVGPERPTGRTVLWCREEPAGAGPVAAIAAALPLIDAATTVVAAADLPNLRPAIPPLLSAVGSADAAVLVDPDGHRNVLAAAWRTAALRRAVADLPTLTDVPVRRLYSGVAVSEVPDPAGWGRDCDSWDDLAAARALPRQETT